MYMLLGMTAFKLRLKQSYRNFTGAKYAR